MRLLETQPRVSQRELAATLGVSVGKANYCLRALVTKGLVKAENYRKSRNKKAYLYLLTPSGIAAKAALTRRFLETKVREYEHLRAEIEQLKLESGNVEEAQVLR
jgi:EPS-associated MarR family transcriptional regulator